MRLYRMFMSLFQRTQEQPKPTLQRPKAPWTCVQMRFTDGTSRTFIYDRRSLTGKALQEALDPLIDEMEGAEFAGPIEVYRSVRDGSLDHETVGLLAAED
jgi:hypothetical protein